MRRVLRKHRHNAKAASKTRFPGSWTDADIENAIELTLRDPDPETFKRFGDKINFERDVDGVRVRAYVRDDGGSPVFWSAYPPAQR